LAVPLVVLALAAGCAEVPTTGGIEASPQAQSAAAAAVPAASVAQAPAADSTAAPAPPAPPANMWERIRAGYRLQPLSTPLVQEWEQYYARRPDYWSRMVDRGGRYLYHVVEEVERRKMPAEIALLPMIESAYNPQAYSRSHASGMWQFIPSTGKLYGL